MAFVTIPAIDVAAGRLARFTRRGPELVAAHGGDPLVAATSFVQAGATWLHVVDLDLAFDGVQANLDLIRAVADLGVSVQAAGAIVSPVEVEAALAAGADRVVLGSSALGDTDEAVRTIRHVGERLVVGIEVEGGRVSARGRHPSDLPLGETLRAVTEAGAVRLLVTGVARVGTLAGPDLEAIRFAVATGLPVLAAGGIAALTDLTAARDAGAEGAVVGRAALEGGLDLAAAIASLG